MNGGQITDNTALGVIGGAIASMSGSTLNINGTVLSYNTATYAGGVIYNVSTTNQVFEKRARIFGNHAGDGMYTDGFLSVNGALILNNTTMNEKGGRILVRLEGYLGGDTSYVNYNNPDNIAYLR